MTMKDIFMKGYGVMKKYISPEIEITKAEALDILTTSVDTDMSVGGLFDIEI